ncbi:uncharacterized protein LOC136033307 isoform X2 [Artemia franciscana]|uniref:Ig-like domain-containing protein n=1 Tax=Artemia franciscana TaxID=6661 RepID=A0AA88I9Z3_ARTSF|nr:hypothetical protein QYM36_000895 [Artemia franciscana]
MAIKFSTFTNNGALVRPGDTSIPTSIKATLKDHKDRYPSGIYQIDTRGLFYIDEYGRKVEKRIYADQFIHGPFKGLIDHESSFSTRRKEARRPITKVAIDDEEYLEEPTYFIYSPKTQNSGETRIRIGDGYFKNNGRDTELVCEFPKGMDIVSTVSWQKMDGHGLFEEDIIPSNYDHYGRIEIRQYTKGSSLFIRDFTERDEGTYRCKASERYYTSSSSIPRTKLVYQEVRFHSHP